MLTVRQAVELFHLVFLRALVAKGDDKSLFALKGGCNLRFFFGSVRYSEDMDLDVRVVQRSTLTNKVDRLLRAPVVLAPLMAQAIEVVDITAPKQTDTTQRWKLGLAQKGRSPVSTKIEFSRRKAVSGVELAVPIPGELPHYGLSPFLAPHYGAAAAIAQKVGALAGRSEPQARDLFDLGLLFARADAVTLALDATSRARLGAAIDRAMSIGFDEFSAQVVATLHPDHAALYRERDAFDLLQATVVERLEALS